MLLSSSCFLLTEITVNINKEDQELMLDMSLYILELPEQKHALQSRKKNILIAQKLMQEYVVY